MPRIGNEAREEGLFEGGSSAWGPLVLSRRRRRDSVPRSLHHLAGFVMIVAAHEVEERYAKVVRETGISLRDFVVLAEMARAPGISQTGLARRIGLSRARVSEQLASLDMAGYIVREMNTNDLRRRRLYIAHNGQEVVEECNDRLQRVDRGWLGALEVRERPYFTSCLRRLPPAQTGRPTSV